MQVDLTEAVERALLGVSLGIEMRLVRHTGSRWMFETVDLESGTLKIRLSKQRGIIEVLFGSSLDDPREWFTSAEVMRVLGRDHETLSTSNVDEMLAELKAVLRSAGSELVRRFSAPEYLQTRRALLAIRSVENARLASSKP